MIKKKDQRGLENALCNIAARGVMLLRSASSSSGTASFFMRSYSRNVTDVDELVQLLPGRAQVEFWL